uniref:MAPK regulated corepressor interacting protein 2 n=1 Tax=Macaca mulatta TaxID=9544 RepID=A0A5F7ZZH9_MACMU
MYTITKGPSKLVAQRRTGPTQQQVEGRLGELLKCRQPAPPTSQPPRAQPFAQPPGPWPLSRLECNGRISTHRNLRLPVPLSAEEEPRAALGHLSPGRQAGRPGPRVPGGAGAAQDSRLPPPAVGAAPFPPQPCAGLCVLRAWPAGAAHPCPRPCWPGRAQGPARCCVRHCGSHLIWHHPLSRAGGE